MYIVAREHRINVRTTAGIKHDLEITAQLRGISVSALVNSLVVKAIREDKERDPHAFRQASDGIRVATHSRQKIPLVNTATKKRKAG